MRQRLRAFVRDQGGSLTLLTAFAAVAVIGVAALVLDSGLAYQRRRQQQMATDFAALAAAADPVHAAVAAGRALMANGFSDTDIIALETGAYVPDISMPVDQRFSLTATSSQSNAFRVTVRKERSFIFGSFVGRLLASRKIALPIVQTTSTAMTRNLAAFSIGSGLMTLDNGVLNDVLGALIGTNISLSINDYNALASTRINLFTFSQQLATRLKLTAVTYQDLASLNLNVGSALASIAGAAMTSQASAALNAVVNAYGSRAATVQLGSLINYGPYATLPVKVTGPLMLSVSALDLVSAFLHLANNDSQINAGLNINLPGIASAKLSLVIGQPPQQSSLIAIGDQGAEIRTAQTRLRLTVTLVGPPTASVITAPIVVNAASASATLSSAQCPASSWDPAVTLQVRPSVIQAWIGSIDDANLQNLQTAPSLQPVALVNLPSLVRVTGSAYATISDMAPRSVAFTPAEIDAGTGKSVSTTQYVAPLLSSLVNNLQLSVYALGLSFSSPAIVQQAVGQTLANVASPLDNVIYNVLRIAGVSVGNAVVWVSGERCGQSALVR